MNKVIVIGGDHHNTYGVLRALGVKKVSPFLLLVSDNHDSFLLKSKYIADSKQVTHEDEAINFLIMNKNNFIGSVIIACSDGISSALDLNYNSLSDFYKLPGAPEEGKITAVMHKEAMSNLGREVGFDVPKSWIVKSIDDIHNVEYPCITKPILSKDGHKTDIAICLNKKELEELIKNGSCYCYQVQKFIDKDFEYQLIGLSIDGGREIIIPGYSKCIRPCPGTNTGFLHYKSLDESSMPISKCKYFVQRTKYSGLFSLEFLRDKKGVDYFMEMNFRNDGNAICVTASGTNLPYIWYLANIGENYKNELERSTFRSLYAMPEFPDFENFVYAKKITLLSWLKDVFRANVFMVFNFKDMHPFIYIITKRIKNILNKYIHCK